MRAGNAGSAERVACNHYARYARGLCCTAAQAHRGTTGSGSWCVPMKSWLRLWD